MHVKRLLKKTLLYIFPLYFLWVIYIETMPNFYNLPNNTRWQFIKNCLNGREPVPETKILFLGESRLNAALDLSAISNSFSFASGGATPVEMFYVLKKFIKTHNSPDTVFYSISPRFMIEIFGFYDYSVRNNFFTYKEICEINDNYKTNPGDTVLGNFVKLKYLTYKADYLEYYQNDVRQSHIFGAYRTNINFIEQMRLNKGIRAHPGLKDSCSELNHETRYVNFSPSPLLWLYLDKTIELCEQKNIVFIFESMPVNKSSYASLNPIFLSEYENFMQKLAEKHQNSTISDSLYSYDDKYFGDESHLNPKGRQKYTEYITSKYFKR